MRCLDQAGMEGVDMQSKGWVKREDDLGGVHIQNLLCRDWK